MISSLSKMYAFKLVCDWLLYLTMVYNMHWSSYCKMCPLLLRFSTLLPIPCAVTGWETAGDWGGRTWPSDAGAAWHSPGHEPAPGSLITGRIQRKHKVRGNRELWSHTPLWTNLEGFLFPWVFCATVIVRNSFALTHFEKDKSTVFYIGSNNNLLAKQFALNQC